MTEEIISTKHAEEQKPVTESPTVAPKTVDDHMKDLALWLKERGVTLAVAAQGRKSGVLCPVDDFAPDTHVLIPVIAEAK